ncbi:MAG: hypothetical protein QQN63_00685 [Nitrosopumilus sp.]
MYNHAVSIAFSINSKYNNQCVPAIDLAAALVKRAAEILSQELREPSSTSEAFDLYNSYELEEHEAKQRDNSFGY